MKQTLALMAAALLVIGCDWLGVPEKCDRCECAAGCCESGTCEHNCGCACIAE